VRPRAIRASVAAIEMLRGLPLSAIERDTDRRLESLAGQARAERSATPWRIPLRFCFAEVGL